MGNLTLRQSVRLILDLNIKDMHTGDFVFELYIAGNTPAATRAIGNLEKLCAELLEVGQYKIDIINIVESPNAAVDNGVLATPTVIRKSPEPRATVIGDLADKERVISGLCLFNMKSE
ncbi:MAG: circadian clock KaiB family protein [Gimesia sp.]|nr:circadian clock KaiB family protein [Gimesia sp.]